MWAEARPYSALMPANLITLAHFSDSVATYAPNSVAVKITGIVPKSASRALMVGFASPALMSRLSRAMISARVPFGAPTPAHVLASYPGSASTIGHERDPGSRNESLRAGLCEAWQAVAQ